MRLPKRADSQPVSGIATSEPAATDASASPSVPSESSRFDLIAGIRTAHVPISAPLSAKTSVTARRAARALGAIAARSAARRERRALIAYAPPRCPARHTGP